MFEASVKQANEYIQGRGLNCAITGIEQREEGRQTVAYATVRSSAGRETLARIAFHTGTDPEATPHFARQLRFQAWKAAESLS